MSDKGSVTIWMLGLSLLVLALGGLAIDLWRVAIVRSDLVAVADSASLAASLAIDEEVWRSEGVAVLVSSDAESRARAVVDAHEVALSVSAVDVAPDGRSVTVSLGSVVDFTLLRLLHPTGEPFAVRVSATAVPQPRP